MKNPKASIIIPVYNAEKYLEKCIKSALNQTYKNYEIILIDDGSTDSSLKIMEKFQTEYPNIVKIYSQENAGVAITRNQGIEYSTGEYLFFMDNDDYIDSDYIEKFINKAVLTDADYVLGGHRQIENDEERIKVRRLTNDSWSKFRFLTPWARTYKKQFLNDHNIRFLDTKMGEEIYCSVLAAVHADKVAILNYEGYNWRFNHDSVSHTLQKGFQKTASPLKLLYSVVNSLDLDNIAPKKQVQLEYFYVKYCIWYLLDSGRGVGLKSMKTEYEEIFGVLKKYFPSYKSNRLIRITKPVGETLLTRTIVWGIVNLSRIKLDKVVFYLYSIL